MLGFFSSEAMGTCSFCTSGLYHAGVWAAFGGAQPATLLLALGTGSPVGLHPPASGSSLAPAKLGQTAALAVQHLLPGKLLPFPRTWALAPQGTVAAWAHPIWV